MMLIEGTSTRDRGSDRIKRSTSTATNRGTCVGPRWDRDKHYGVGMYGVHTYLPTVAVQVCTPQFSKVAVSEGCSLQPIGVAAYCLEVHTYLQFSIHDDSRAASFLHQNPCAPSPKPLAINFTLDRPSVVLSSVIEISQNHFESQPHRTGNAAKETRGSFFLGSTLTSLQATEWLAGARDLRRA